MALRLQGLNVVEHETDLLEVDLECGRAFDVQLHMQLPAAAV